MPFFAAKFRPTQWGTSLEIQLSTTHDDDDDEQIRRRKWNPDRKLRHGERPRVRHERDHSVARSSAQFDANVNGPVRRGARGVVPVTNRKAGIGNWKWRFGHFCGPSLNNFCLSCVQNRTIWPFLWPKFEDFLSLVCPKSHDLAIFVTQVRRISVSRVSKSAQFGHFCGPRLKNVQNRTRFRVWTF